VSWVELRLVTVGLASVQDLGRPGHGHLGISENGAADSWAARAANVLAGNPVGAPLIEITGSEFSLQSDTDLLLAVTGAAARVLVAGVNQPAWETLIVPAGRTVTTPAPERGLRSYLAVNGELDVPSVLGSVAPDRLLGTGRMLRSGDTLRLESSFTGLNHPYSSIPLFRMGAVPGTISSPLLVETTRGPDAGEFAEHLDGALPDEYEVSPQSDSIGLRLVGPTPRRGTDREILSRGVPVGAIEVAPGGGLLLLLRGRLVTAGYPVVAVATLDSIDRLGQARPGDQIRFQLVDAEQARRTYRQRHAQLESLASRVRTAFAAVGLPPPSSPSPQKRGAMLDGGSRGVPLS
jgi:5-oxoprolinase (ATP-hydrolysing) subunit C